MDGIYDKILRGGRITEQEALQLWEAPLAQLGALARARKEAASGDEVYYNRNIHIEPTNICKFGCRFCSYWRAEENSEAWNYSLDEIEAHATAQRDTGITEVHIVGGVHPAHDLEYYAEILRRVRRALPAVAIKAYTAIELAEVISRAGLSFTEGLRYLRAAGLSAIPGGGAEIFAPRVRQQICPEKGDVAVWIALHEAAHQLSIPTNATMLYGHIETPTERIAHLVALRDLQDRSKGFDAFVPLKFRRVGNLLGANVEEVAVTDDMRILAISRIVLDNIPHIKAYWVMYGKDVAEMALAFGADDIDGTIGDTTRIYSMAGASDRNPTLTIPEIEAMARSAGLRAVERDTFYNKR